MKNIIIYFALILAIPSFLSAQYKGGDGGGTSSSGIINAPLPVQLSSFTSSVNVRNIKLNWITASEQNNSGFDIERTETGSSNSGYRKIGFVTGNGTKNTPTNYSYEDKNLNTGKYQYRLKQIDNNGNFEYHNLNGIAEIGIPAKFNLSQNYPNPFNPTTKINFDIPNDSRVNITIYDVSGRDVRTIVNEYKNAGYYTVQFDASGMSSGVYFYRLSIGGNNSSSIITKKLTVIK